MNETCCELSYDCTSLATETFTELATGLPIDKILVSVKCPMDGSNVSDRKKNDGLGRIRTGDLRHVKTEAFKLNLSFVDFFTRVSAVLSADETTTRNASAPPCSV